jgi:hypothetical protein
MGEQDNLAAWASANQVVLGQVKVEELNEITTIPQTGAGPEWLPARSMRSEPKRNRQPDCG